MLAISVIIPTWRDTEALQSLLPSLAAMQPPALEIIVVDGAADAEVVALCDANKVIYITAAAGRGTQLNCGARRAQGAVLWFVHADAAPDSASLAAIEAAVQRGARAGYFRFRFAGERSLTRSLLERCIGWRCRFGTVYGDQALFITRQAWQGTEALFEEVPLFEEVALVKRLKCAGAFTALDTAVGVSPRRWQRDGWWRRTLMNRLLALGYILGVPPAQLARWYTQQKS